MRSLALLTLSKNVKNIVPVIFVRGLGSTGTAAQKRISSVLIYQGVVILTWSWFIKRCPSSADRTYMYPKLPTNNLDWRPAYGSSQHKFGRGYTHYMPLMPTEQITNRIYTHTWKLFIIVGAIRTHLLPYSVMTSCLVKLRQKDDINARPLERRQLISKNDLFIPQWHHDDGN